MIMRNTRALLLATVTTLTLAACSFGGPSKPVQYYTLSPQPGEAVALQPGGQLPLIGVGPVTLPELFDRPQIVTRPDAYRVDMAEYDRWGSSLASDVPRVLKQNLMSRLNDDNIVDWPWQRHESPVLQVIVQFYRFDGESGKQANLSGTWQLLDAEGGCRLEAHQFDLMQAADGPGYAEFVAALSHGLAQLSQEIAEHLAVAVPGCRQGNP
jgi:uncharacterized lipoprotein YmbA